MSEERVWYIAIGGQKQGPWTREELVAKAKAGDVPAGAHLYGPGMTAWQPIAVDPELAGAVGAAVPPPPLPPGGAHEIDYEILGHEMQLVEVTLDPQEACIAEAGAFLYMDPGIQMETVFGDGSAQDQAGGLAGKLLGAGKRILTGESLFMTVFANTASTRQTVAFGSPYPGKIVPVDLRSHGGRLLCQKDAFLCAAKGISVGIALQKRIGVGLFGGEGFILQKLEGDGLAFVHAGGTIVERELAAGERWRLDTGCLVALEQTVDYDIQTVPGIKTAFFGGEGLFFAVLTGPGKVWVQSLPFSRLAGRIYKSLPRAGGSRKGEGSVLGGLGDLVMGD